jgi:hypothetical protein
VITNGLGFLSGLRPLCVGTGAGAVEPRCNGPTVLVSNMSKEQAKKGRNE